MDPGVPIGSDQRRDYVTFRQFGEVKVGILIDRDGTVAAGPGSDQMEHTLGALVKDFSA